MARLKSLLKLIRINVTILICGLIIIELLLWGLFPIDDPFLILKTKEATDAKYIESQFRPGLKLIMSSNEGMPGLKGKTLFSINNLGFRGDHWENSKNLCKKIVMIGGSTTECLYLDDSESLPRKLQENLCLADKNNCYQVYGAGKSGDATQDHIAMLTQRIVHLKPDAVIIFCGINDLRRMASTEFNALNIPKYPAQPFTGNFKKDLSLVLSYTQIFRRIYNILKNNESENQEIRIITNYKQKIDETKNLSLGQSFPFIDLRIYETNLRTLIASCKANDINIVLMTQAVTWGQNSMIEYHWMNYVNGQRFDSLLMLKELDKFNKVMKKVAFEENVHCFDLANEISLTKEYFYDDCHFNPRGANLAAQILATSLVEKGVIFKLNSE